MTASGAGQEVGILVKLRTAEDFAVAWKGRINDHLAEVELGPAWRAALRAFGVFGSGGGESQFRQLLYSAILRRVIAAMRTGQTPQEAGIEPSLFPPEYMAAITRSQQLRAQASALAVEVYIGGRATTLESDIRELLDEADRLRSPVDLDFIHDFIYSTPVLDTVGERHALYADVLVDDIEAQDLAEPWFDPVVAELEVAAAALDRGDAELAAAFFTRLGPDQAARLDMHFRRQADQSPMRRFSQALADASYFLSDGYARDIMRAAGAVPYGFEPGVGQLFMEGSFDYAFLLAAYDESEYQFDNRDYVHTGYELKFDARAALLDRLTENSQFNAVAFFTPERISELFDDGYVDDGFSAMKSLLTLGAMAPDLPGVRNRVAAIVSHVAQAGGTLQHFTAVGAAAMVDAHIPLFAPERWFNPVTGEFDQPIFSHPTSQDLQLFDYGPTDSDGQTAFEKHKIMFLEVVMRDPQAQEMLFGSVAATIRRLGQDHITDPSSARAAADELGALIGRFADVAGGIAQQNGAARDSANRLNQWLVGTTVAVAGSLLAGHFIVGGVSATILKQVIGRGRATATSFALDRVFPTDNQHQALEARFHDVVDVDAGRAYVQFITRLLFESSPELFDADRIPPEVVANGRWVDPYGSTHGYCIDPGRWDEVWLDWWNSNPFVDYETYQAVAPQFTTYLGSRALGSDERVNGPDLPFTRP